MAEHGSVTFPCPECGTEATVSQVQGDRCGGCGFEFKWFAADEARTVEDFLAVLTGRRHRLELQEGGGFIIAHE